MKSIVGEDIEQELVDSEIKADITVQPFLGGQVLGTINENADSEDSDDSFD